jgi:[DsrC]-trisulfide reductase subunit J
MGQIMRFAGAVLAVMLTVAGFANAGESRAQRVALPVVKIEKGTACVAPTEEMRRDHMKMLLQQRDRTVHQGLREPRFSLKNCVDCHASRETGSVLGKEGFCSSCHSYAAVSIDCFECHTPLRQSGTAVVSR